MQQGLLTFAEHSAEQVNALLDLAADFKADPYKYRQALAGKSIVGLFEKPSLRTRVSFDIGINKLGGHFLYLDCQDGQLSGRETLEDIGANLGCWADGIVARVFKHQTLIELGKGNDVPVVNALCDLYHPCQGLADYLTLKQAFGDLKGLKVAYIGDGNNVTHSLMILGAILGVHVTAVCPKGYEPHAPTVAKAVALAAESGVTISVTDDINALQDMDVLYTDTWISMGDNTKFEQIEQTFMPYQLTMDLFKQTGAKYVLHCQPAHREQEITSELMDSPYSLLLQQAENRMHAQNAILIDLFK
ncbi:ornithine carbamoyltransferase [Neptunicella marina]|uniref:Ornithine carbamoyltransferase n=1 Tax=Neptunicella marina TaxID=2125989 RepID=A0A8J6IWY1_9ALTE|nr:ornithine carbamoyltransferase [Neptunicella marina]MBC3767624.1 ornithine carbamoyltransferase [Neptunicella marina]